MKEKCGVIYILTNPSFPEYIKIGYADDVELRVKQLNNSEAVPFSFHIYATFDVTERLTDIKLHKFIDTINPELRSKEKIGDKIRVREFYHMSPEEMYSAFESMTEINGTTDRLHLWKETNEDGTLGIYEKDSNIEVPNNSNPSKRQILYSALEDLGGDVTSGNTLYQLEHKLEKILVNRK